MKKKTVTIQIGKGTGDASAATPAAMMVQLASKYDCNIYMDSGNVHVNAKSIMGMMAFDFTSGFDVEITAEGDDEEKAVEGLEKFLTGKID